MTFLNKLCQFVFLLLGLCFILNVFSLLTVNANCVNENCNVTDNYSIEQNFKLKNNHPVVKKRPMVKKRNVTKKKAGIKYSSCKDHPMCKLWKEKAGFCRNRVYDKYTKISICPTACGYCKEPVNNEIPYDVWKHSLNEKINPCDDFYQFTCGKYISEHPIKNQKGYELYSAFSSPETSVNQCMQDAILKPKPTKSEAIKKFQQYQAKFMEIAELNKIRTTEIIKEIKAFGGCPVLPESGWSAAKFNVVDMLKKIGDLTGRTYLFNLGIKKMLNDSTMQIIVEPTRIIISSPGGYVDQKLELFPDKAQLLTDYISELLGLVASDMRSTQTYANLQKIATDVVKFDASLLKTYTQENYFVDPRSITYDTETKTRLDDLKRFIPIVNGKEYLTSVLKATPELQAYFNGNPVVYARTESLIKKLNQIYTNTISYHLANYLCVRYLIDQVLYLDDRFIDASQRFAKRLTGIFELPPRSIESVQVLTSIFPLVTDHMFITECSDPKTRPKIVELVDKIQIAVNEMLKEQKWMDDDTKKAALHKLAKTKKIVGVTETAYDVKKLDNRYKDLKFGAGDSLREMNKKITLYMTHDYLKIILEPNKYGVSETIRATTVNAANIQTENAIFIISAALNSPNFNASMPAAINYGGIGGIIGHEYLHSFDTIGLEFDENGNKRNWWKPETFKKFKDRTQCFIDQYGKQIVKQVGRKVDGKNTITENVSDNGGLKAAFLAYKKHLKGKKEIHVPGYSKYTNEQSFFIAHGVAGCGVASDKAWEYLLTDQHAPYEFRINVVLSNFPEFAKAFKCKKGSKMAPQKFCTLW